MKLDERDLQSALWLRLRAHLSERMEVYRRQNDGALTPEETTRLRGRIAQLKEILALHEPEQSGETDDAMPTNGQLLAGFTQE